MLTSKYKSAYGSSTHRIKYPQRNKGDLSDFVSNNY